MNTDESMETGQRIALVAGASGMVGTALCSQLRRDRRFAPVVVLARSRPPVTDPPLRWLRRRIKPIRIGGVALDVAFLLVMIACSLGLALLSSLMVRF